MSDGQKKVKVRILNQLADFNYLENTQFFEEEETI
jgi:hypothetical protein